MTGYPVRRPAPLAASVVPLVFLLLLAGVQPGTGQVTPPREMEIALHDANPGLTGGQYLAGWDANRLATVNLPREGAATDGVSRLLVRVEAPGPGTVEVEIVTRTPENGVLSSLSGPEAILVGDRYLFFALYTPPPEFGPREGADGRWHDEVDFRGVGIRARFTGVVGGIQETGSAIILTRPPLVLVHGTFDNPVAAWQTASDLGPAPVDAFSAAGFRPFAVDYSGSSAAPATARTGRGVRPNESWLNPGESSFQSNRRVVLENPNGILAALDHYRNQLGIAATQADVVGHSLGGILGRVLASEDYNPDYYTSANFNQGWINRLITVNSPHHGSDLPAALGFFEEAKLMEHRTWAEWLIAWSIPLAAWWEGRSASAANAVRDQLPLADALDEIGETDVPSHAVVATMDISRLRDDQPTELLFTGIAAIFYYFPGLLSDYFASLVHEWTYLPPEYRMTTAADGSAPPFRIDSPGAYDDYLQTVVMEAMNVESEFWLSRRDENWLMTVRGLADRPQVPPGFMDTGFGEDPAEYGILDEIAEGAAATWELGVALQNPVGLTDQVVPFPLVDFFRNLIFRNDLNDGTVRLQSQTGSLDPRYVTRIETPVVHSISPRYPVVQQAIIDALEAGGERFAPDGFPRAGQQLPAWLPSRRLNAHYPDGEEAICWSGMVWDHAEAFAAVADSAQAIVLVRPVNPDATALIARNVATKGMAVKGKSSNWGPQVGFIAEHQRFSKLWRNLTGNSRTAAIEKYDGEVESVVSSGLAVLRELRLTFDDQPGAVYTVYEDPQVEDAETAIHLVRGEGDNLEACVWGTPGGTFSRQTGPASCRSVESTEGWEPLRVLADPGERDSAGQARYLTADYDLLAIGFREPPLPVPYQLHSFLPNYFPNDRGERTVPGMTLPRRDGPPDTLRFDGVEGFITPEQSALLRALNRKVGETGYVAGRVTHHGPENHYSGSPYVDYPITVFEPSREGPGRVVSIPMGPAGFRDVHLKRYLLQKRQEGFNLVPNPQARGWQWETWGEYSAVTGWDPRDASALPAYAAELPMPEPCTPIRQLPDEPIVDPEDSVPELPAPEPILEVRADAEPLAGREPDPEGVADPSPAVAPETPPTSASPLPEYLITDDLTAYFQPARDTTETVWRWRFVRVDESGDTALVRSGLFTPGGGEFDNTDRVASGDPAPFLTELGQLWNDRAPGPGSYLLQSCLPRAVPGLLGQTSGWSGCLRPFVDQETGQEEPLLPWQDEDSFVVGDVDLELKGIVLEQGAVPFGEEGRQNGRIRLEPDSEGGDGAGTGAVLRVEWDACVNPARPDVQGIPPCSQAEPGWRRERQVTRIRLKADVPETLDLQAAVPAGFQVTFVTLEGEHQATAELHDLAPRAQGPDRELGELGFVETLMDIHAGSNPEPDDSRSALPPPPLTSSGYPVDVHLHSRFPFEAGQPERPLGELIRDPSVHWFLPVELSVVGKEIFAFIVYGAQPGPYTGPQPMAPGAVDAPPADSTQGVAADSAGVGGDPNADPGGGVDRPVDPDALNPNDPDISGLIREWIGVARPPTAVEPDNFYVYDEWGRMVGNGADGNITGGNPPEARGSMPSVEYVWTLRDDLDSVDHCTLEEYVVRTLEEEGIAECRGRYQPTPRAPDFTGQPVGPVRTELQSAGHRVEVSIGAWPESPELAYTIIRQRPAPGERLRDSTQLSLTIYGAYQEPEPAGHTVVGVYGLTFEDAKAMLADSGFAVPAPAGGNPAPTQDMAFRVSTQSVAGGQIRSPGTEIRLTLFGPFNPNAPVRRDDPPPPPPNPGPSCNDLVTAANRAQGRGDLSAAYELFRTALANGCRNPGLQDAMGSVYQSPQCTNYIRTARGAYDRGDFRSAIQALRSAERSGCDMSGLGPLVDGTLEALETGVAEAMDRSCSGLAAEIAAARRRGDEAAAQALTTTGLIQGCSRGEITSAAATPLGTPGQSNPPGVEAGPPAGEGEGRCYDLSGATVFGQDPPPDAVMFIYKEQAGDRVVYHVIEQYNIGSLDSYSEIGGQLERLDWRGSYSEAVEYVKRACGGGGAEGPGWTHVPRPPPSEPDLCPAEPEWTFSLARGLSCSGSSPFFPSPRS